MPHSILAEAMLDAGWTRKLLEEPGNEHAVEDFCSKTFGLKTWGNKLAQRVKEQIAAKGEGKDGKRKEIAPNQC